MLLRKNPKTVISLGMMALALASISQWALRHSSLNEDVVDALTGFGYGVAIAAMLLGIWMRGRQQSRK